MNDLLSRDVKEFGKRRARRRRWQGVLSVLASIVVFATTYALILPAITMTAAHVHDESCYTQLDTIEKEVLACPVSAEDGITIVHRHDDGCYDENGALVCTLPELSAHTHTESCYEMPEEHTHTDDCYYYNVYGEPICGLEENEEHSHTDACYAQQKVLICGQTEGEAAEPVLVCGRQEVILHRHDDGCYDESGALVCTLPEVIAHQHTSRCFETRKVPADTTALTCTNTDPDHVHTALCYGTWVLTCDQAEDDETQDAPADEDPNTDKDEDGEKDPDGEEEPADDELPDAPDSDDEAPSAPDDDAPDDALDNQIDSHAGQVMVKYYIYLDDAPHLVSEGYEVLPVENERHYTTAEKLEAVYGTFGFRADAYSGERFFPHTDHNDPTEIWADAPAYQAQTADGTAEWRIPLSRRVSSYVYYVPNNIEGREGYFDENMDRYDAALIRNNTFYTVNVSAPPDAASLSGISYVQRGEPLRIELPVFADYVWSFSSLADGSELSPDSIEELEDGKIAVTFKSVVCPIKIAALQTVIGERKYTIQYHANTLASNLQRLSSEVGLSAQSIVTDGKVGGMASLSEQLEVTEDTVYQLRVPDSQTLIAQSNVFLQEKYFFYTFRGWRVTATGEVLNPDEPLTAVQLAACETGGVITLEAVWSALDARERIASVNFYLNLKCEIRDFHSNGFTDVGITDFTKSLFATPILGTEQLTTSQSNFLLLAPPTTEATAYDVDARLRTMTDTPYEGVTLEEFPSDTEIFALLREHGYTIQILGQDIPMQYLTSDYFQVRWATLKYQSSDGWHVDGVLVAKEAKLRVTKTFLGSGAAIDAVKAQTGDQEYSILIENISHNGASGERLTLVPAEQEMREDCVGYDTYDPESNTYTWIASGRVDSDYRLSEQNYLLEDTPSTSYYRVSDTANPGSWQSYDDDALVSTKMGSYASDMPQRGFRTVSFQNAYIETGTLALRKVDDFTDNGIAGVEFRLTADDDSQTQPLRRKPGTSMYTNTNLAGSEYTEEAGNSIVTDANGDAFLRLIPGAYTLREAFPDGYSGAEEIHFTVDESGVLTKLTLDGTAASGAGGGIVSGVGTAILRVENHSHILTTVTAVKDWGEVPEDWQRPVKVTLMCGGAPLGGADSAYTQVLSAENGWAYVWEDLPLFIDGKVASYTIREIMIGDTPYNSSLPDGYRDYAVTYDPAKYREADTGDYEDPAAWVDEEGGQHYANHVLLTVHNRPDGDVGEITVAKRFESIDGGPLEKLDGTYTFALYEASDGSGTPAATASVIYANGAVTPEDGAAHFSSLPLGKTYYVFELDDSGNPVPAGESRIISGTPCTALGGGAAVALSPEHPAGEAEITNRINYAELPETGGSGLGAFYLAGGLITLCAAWLLLRKRRAGC